MSNLIEFSGHERPLDIAWKVEREYRGQSGVSIRVQAGHVAAALVVPMLELADIPEPLHGAFRDRMHGHLVDLFSKGSGIVTDDDIYALASRCRRAAPTVAKAQAAFADNGVLQVGDKGFWAQGMLQYLGVPQVVAWREPDLVESLQYLVDRSAHENLPVSDRTEMITNTVVRWAKGRKFRPAKEVSVPVLTPGSRYFGRADLIIFRAPNPPLFIEIDSTPNDRSAPKLDFARRAGAIPIWIRFHQGEAQKPPQGVSVIDHCNR